MTKNRITVAELKAILENFADTDEVVLTADELGATVTAWSDDEATFIDILEDEV